MAESPTMKVLTKGQKDGNKATAKTTKAPAKKAVKTTKSKVKTGEVVGKDLILDTVQELENMNQAATLKGVRACLETAGYSNFQLGGLLQRIQEEGWWDNGEHESFKDFIQAEYGLGLRKAAYLMAIYTGLVESGVKWEQVQALGWTKLRELVSMLTVDNVDEWVEKAKEMTTLQLIEYIKAEKAQGKGDKDAPTKEEAQKIKTKTFKLHADQLETVDTALERAREEGETEYDTVALDYICMRYLSNDAGKAKTTKPPTLEKQFKEAGVDKVLEAFEEAFPECNITVAM